MLSTKYKFIFVHVPKTGGSSTLESLLPYSDASRLVGYGNRGQHWDLKDPVANSMHEPILSYKRFLGEEFKSFNILVGFRDPFERMLSLYFSPHFWRSYSMAGRIALGFERRFLLPHRPISNGPLGVYLERISPVRENVPFWNEDAFSELVIKAVTHSDLLRVEDGSFFECDHIIPLRFRQIESDFARAVERLELPLNPGLANLAQGRGSRGLVDSLRKSKDLRHFVEMVQREDYDRFHDYF